MEHVLWTDVTVTGGFWKARQEINRRKTLPAEYRQCKTTGRLDSIKCVYRPGGEAPKPHHYWDSDIAKWIEAASYSLANEPSRELEDTIDGIVNDFERLQCGDGYMNTYYTVVEPGKRFTNIYQMHELYCVGHLIEAAVAYYQATGKRKLLDILCRYADCIDRTFGPEDGKIHGYPGHQEIELALVKLYRTTGVERYLRLGKYFLDERGKQPYFFEQEALAHGRDPEDGGPKGILGKSFLSKGPYALFQSHLPLREQDTAEGHAVRLMYMCSGAADVAVESGDQTLLDACRTLWNSVTRKRMYVTGGVGAQDVSERFSFDYQLPNESAYNETCASIGLVMWASRMLQAGADREYGDIMERALYNGVISGISLSGDRFFYANHLASHPGVYGDRIVTNPRMLPERQDWFPVSCCPTNLARLTESIGGYIYSASQDTVYVHLFIDSTVRLRVGSAQIRIEQKTEYPWDPGIALTISSPSSARFRVAVRIPAWCRKAQACVNGEAIDAGALEKGYLYIDRVWGMDDRIDLTLSMEPLLLEANPAVRMDCGKVAIQYGPIIYCLEEADNGKNLFDITLTPQSVLTAHFESDLLGGVTVLTGNARRRKQGEWQDALYRSIPSDWESCTITAIPYYTWSNRGAGEMTVWIRYDE